MTDIAAPPQQVQMLSVQVALGAPDRPAMLAFPTDMTDLEALILVRAVTDAYDQVRAQRAASSLVVARVMPDQIGVPT